MTYPNNDGGSAFPGGVSTYPNDQGAPTQYGMTLRDYFAAKAMQAHMGRLTPEYAKALEENEFDTTVARWAYEMADAMLEARKES